MQTFIHEVGHNWDNATENGFMPLFMSMGGWTQSNPSVQPGYIPGEWVVRKEYGQTWFYHRTLDSALFARPNSGGDGYSTVHPVEDWATAFSLYIMAFGGLQYNAGGGVLVDAATHLTTLQLPGFAINDKVDVLYYFFANLEN